MQAKAISKVLYESHAKVAHAPIATLLDKGKLIREHCGGLPSTCPSSQDPLIVQGKLTTCLGSFRLDQDELCLAPEVKAFPHFTMPDGWIDQAEWPFRLTYNSRQNRWIESVGPIRWENQSNQVLKISYMCRFRRMMFEHRISCLMSERRTSRLTFVYRTSRLTSEHRTSRLTSKLRGLRFRHESQ